MAAVPEDDRRNAGATMCRTWGRGRGDRYCEPPRRGLARTHRFCSVGIPRDEEGAAREEWVGLGDGIDVTSARQRAVPLAVDRERPMGGLEADHGGGLLPTALPGAEGTVRYA